ncbi:MAG: hypothetical protein M3Y37_08335 [Chloroflexota bacterium]|jgi:hypothetical protein|nr:hypothetical protein [Chloroflexota bacterium]
MWAYSLADLRADLVSALSPHGIRVDAVGGTSSEVTVQAPRSGGADFVKQFSLPDAMLTPIVGQRLIKVVLDWYEVDQSFDDDSASDPGS